MAFASGQFINPQKLRGIERLLLIQVQSFFLELLKCHALETLLHKAGIGCVQARLPISSRKRAVVFLRQPHAVSGSVKAFRHRKQRKRRLSTISSTRCSRNARSRFFLGRVSWILTQGLWQCGQVAWVAVAITSTLIVPVASHSWFTMWNSARSNGTRIAS